jgi:hypothetical protein
MCWKIVGLLAIGVCCATVCAAAEDRGVTVSIGLPQLINAGSNEA